MLRDGSLIPAWISNNMPCKVWDEITYPFPNYNGSTVEVWEWISNFIPHFILDVITYRILIHTRIKVYPPGSTTCTVILMQQSSSHFGESFQFSTALDKTLWFAVLEKHIYQVLEIILKSFREIGHRHSTDTHGSEYIFSHWFWFVKFWRYLKLQILTIHNP